MPTFTDDLVQGNHGDNFVVDFLGNLLENLYQNGYQIFAVG